MTIYLSSLHQQFRAGVDADALYTRLAA